MRDYLRNLYKVKILISIDFLVIHNKRFKNRLLGKKRIGMLDQSNNDEKTQAYNLQKNILANKKIQNEQYFEIQKSKKIEAKVNLYFFLYIINNA